VSFSKSELLENTSFHWSIPDALHDLRDGVTDRHKGGREMADNKSITQLVFHWPIHTACCHFDTTIEDVMVNTVIPRI